MTARPASEAAPPPPPPPPSLAPCAMKTIRALSDEAWALVVVVAVVGVCFLSTTMGALTGRSDGDVHRRATALLKQSQRWNAMSAQDANPIFAMRHSNFATAYLEAARALTSDDFIRRTTGQQVTDMLEALARQHRNAIAKLGQTCPKSLPKGTTMTSWLD